MSQRSDEFMSYADVAPSYKLGRHRRFRRVDVEKWAEARFDAPQPAA